GAKGAVPTLLELLKGEGRDRANFALAAVLIDPDNAKAAQDWVRKRISEDTNEAFDIREDIAQLGGKAKPFVPELMVMLKSAVPHHRENAIETLGDIGPAAKDALPLLREIAEKDPKPHLREYAARAIKRIEGE